VTGNTNAGLFSIQPSISSLGTLTYTPTVNAFGLATVTVLAKDNGGTVGSGSDTSLSKTFTPVANFVAHWTGRPVTFLVCCVLVVAWAASGPLFGFSDTWQLVINTSTTIITFLMGFLIQNTQNRDNLAIQVKHDELIRASRAPNSFIGVEHMTDEEREALVAECEEVAESRGVPQTKANNLAERSVRAELSGPHSRLTKARNATGAPPKKTASSKPKAKTAATTPAKQAGTAAKTAEKSADKAATDAKVATKAATDAKKEAKTAAKSADKADKAADAAKKPAGKKSAGKKGSGKKADTTAPKKPYTSHRSVAIERVRTTHVPRVRGVATALSKPTPAAAMLDT
jgi:low affinity Fe/Cu permease